VYSDEGDVTIDAGPGNDWVIAIGGRVLVDGRDGNDRIRTGPFDDQVTGGFGADSLDSGGGDDTIRVKDKKRDRVECGPGRDTIYADKVDSLLGCEDVHTRGARIG
jgi:Ca2+-binding RTX toxin-like protein